MVQLNNDGLLLDSEDLNNISPGEGDHMRVYLHDGSSTIDTGNNETSSEPGLYLWNQTERVWFPAGRYSEILNGFRSEDLAKEVDFQDHSSDTTNPHNVDHSQVGAYSTSDADTEFLTRSGDSLLGDLDVSGNSLLDGTTTIWDTLNGHVPLSSLEESESTVIAGTNLSGGGTVSLGGSITLDIVDGRTSGLTAQEALEADNALELGNNLPSYYAVDDDLQGHKQDTLNPHDVTPGQVGSPSQLEYDNHAADNSAHHIRYDDSEARTAVDGASVSILGAASATESNLSDHEGNTLNPHNVTYTQAGAPSQGSHDTLRSDHDSHEGDTTNPHSVTTGQINAINQSELAVAGGVATLDGSKTIPDSQLPSLAISDTFVVANQTERLALTAERGDVAIQDDVSNSYILKGDDASLDSNWSELKTPESPVQSVLGRTGDITAEVGDYSHNQISGIGSSDHHTRYGDGEARTAVDGASVSILGSASATQDNLTSHEGDTTNPHSVTAAQAGAVDLAGDTMTGELRVENQINAQSAMVLHPSNGADRWKMGYGNNSVDTFRDGSFGYRLDDVNNNNSVFWAEYGGNILDFNYIPHHNGNQLATQTWVGNNYNNYSDSDARLAVDGAALSIQGVANSTQSDVDSHVIDTTNPHGVTNTQVGAPAKTNYDTHVGDSSAHHSRYTDTEATTAVDGSSVSITGSAGSTQTDVDNHIADTTNPHGISPSQIGAITSQQSDEIHVGPSAPSNPSENTIWIRTN